MHIPQEYGKFGKPTLIAATDSTEARLFLADNNIVEFLETISSNYPPKNNIDRTSGQVPSGTHFAEQSEKIKMTSREKLYHALSERLMHLLQHEKFEELAIAAPEEHLEELKENLHIDLIKKTKVWIPKLLTTEDMLDIVIHVQEEMFPES